MQYQCVNVVVVFLFIDRSSAGSAQFALYVACCLRAERLLRPFAQGHGRIRVPLHAGPYSYFCFIIFIMTTVWH